MRRFISVVLVLCVLANPVFAHVKIRKENRVLNIPPGFCAFCVLETLGRHNKIKPLYNLVKNREKEAVIRKWNPRHRVWEGFVWTYYGDHYELEDNHGGGDTTLKNKLEELGVKYRVQSYGNFDKSLMKYAVKKNLGCMVVIKDWTTEDPQTKDCHAVLLTDINDEKVCFIDPNDNEEYRVDMDWFEYWWLGYVLVVEKNNE